MKILFQGDSITDSNRDYGDIHDLGDGYAHYAAGFRRFIKSGTIRFG